MQKNIMNFVKGSALVIAILFAVMPAVSSAEVTACHDCFTSNIGPYTYNPSNYNNNNYNNNGYPYPNPNPAPVDQLVVVTNGATNITSTAAKVNGELRTNTPGALTWFEYGTTQNFGNQTSPVYVNGNQYFSRDIAGLAPNTTYFVRTVAQNGSNITRGNILTFVTKAGSVLGTSTTSGVGKVTITKSVVNVSAQSGNGTLAAAAVGETLRYSIVVKNVGTRTLNGLTVIDVLSPALTLKAINAGGTYDEVTRVITWKIATLPEDASATLIFDAVLGETTDVVVNTASVSGDGITKKTSNGTSVVATTVPCKDDTTTTANTNGTGVSSTAGTNGNTGNAAAAGLASGFLPSSMLGWFIALLVIVAIVILGRRLFSKPAAKPAH